MKGPVNPGSNYTLFCDQTKGEKPSVAVNCFNLMEWATIITKRKQIQDTRSNPLFIHTFYSTETHKTLAHIQGESKGQ